MNTSTVNATTNKRPATRIPDIIPTPDTTNPAPLHTMEIKDHKHFYTKPYTTYVNHLKIDRLAAKHLCQHMYNDFTPEHLACIRPEDEDIPILAIPFEVTWKAAWLLEDIVRSLPTGNPSIHNYKISKLPL